jgi:flavin reductase (DIM6/NTAB) family NADH-FMN oxidoreductase RutF
MPDGGQTMVETRFAPDAENARAFRDALGAFATGVTVVTAIGLDGLPVGITANSFASVSLEPPLVLWSPAKASSRHDHFVQAAAFAVHVLAEDQDALAARFVRGGPGFHGLASATNPEGVPLIEGTLARFECATETTHEGGDHTIVIGRVLRVSHRAGAPLCFACGRYMRLTSD